MIFLKVQNASKIYHYDAFPVFENISFELKQGETASIILGECSGKTTIAKVLIGLEKLTSGAIIYMDKPLEQIAPNQREIAFVSVPSVFDKGKVKDNVAYGLKVRGVDKKTAFEISLNQLKKYGLEDKLNTLVKKLSLYERFKLDLARAFCRKVSLLILDDCFQKDDDVDAFLKKEIPSFQEQGCAVLNLCNEKKQAIGTVYDFLPAYEKQN